MIGATTENPFFSVTPAIRSRVQIFELEPLSNQDVKEALQIALTDPERGFDFPVELDEDALDFIATSTNGDLRSAFNSLDLAALSTPENDKRASATSPSTSWKIACRGVTSLWIRMEMATMMFSQPYKVHPWLRCRCQSPLCCPLD